MSNIVEACALNAHVYTLAYLIHALKFTVQRAWFASSHVPSAPVRQSGFTCIYEEPTLRRVSRVPLSGARTTFL